MTKIKKAVSSIINFISIAIILGAIYILFVAINTKSGDTPQIFGYSAFRVMTGSMEPELPVDSFIIVKRVEPEELQVGDVISFYSQDEQIRGMVNTHRIVGIEQDGGVLYFRTKGDANHLVDDDPVPGGEVIGRVVWSSFLLGKLVRLAANPLIFFPIVLLPLIFVLISNICQTLKIARALEMEEMQEMQEKQKLHQAADGNEVDVSTSGAGESRDIPNTASTGGEISQKELLKDR